MKVLFLSKKNREVFDAWYNYISIIKKNRKTIIACNSPLDFCHKFDVSKMGAVYTTFYFDKDLGLADIHARIVELKHHYNNDAFKYIVENKLRTISIADMVETNDMSKFENLHINDLKIKANDSETYKDSNTTITVEEYDHIGMELLHMQRYIDDLGSRINALEKKCYTVWH